MKILLKAGGIFILVCVLGWLVLSRDVLHPTFEDMSVQRWEAPHTHEMSEKIAAYWHSVNFAAKTIPESASLSKNIVQVTNEVKQIMNLNIFVRKALPPQDIVPTNQSILFLHGQKFQSKNWEDLGTLQIMAALGHCAVAIDLPGHGQSGAEKFSGDHAKFLASTLEVLSLREPVVVSPSMSGQFSMPFLAHYPESMSGFVPIAPVATNSIPKSTLQKIQIPTLIIFGDRDATGLAQQARASLSALPNGREFEIAAAGHAAYLDQPALFHQIMYNFLDLIRFQPRLEVGITWRNWKTWKRQGLLSRIK